MPQPHSHSHSHSPSLSHLITAVHSDPNSQDPNISPSISGGQDYSFAANAFDFSFHNPSCKVPSVAYIEDELFLPGTLLPCDTENPKCNNTPMEMDGVSRKARPRWYRFVFRLVRVPLSEMEARDIERHVKRKLANPFLETRKNSVGWKLIRSLSCGAVESVAVTAPAPRNIV